MLLNLIMTRTVTNTGIPLIIAGPGSGKTRDCSRVKKWCQEPLEPAFGSRHLREHISEIPEEESDRDADQHRIPAELAKHRLPGFGRCRDPRVECLDEVVPEAMEKGGWPDAAGRKPDPRKERRAADHGDEEQYHRRE